MALVSFDPADLLTPAGKLECGWFNGKTPGQVAAMLQGFEDQIRDTLSPALDAEPEAQYKALEAYCYASAYQWIADDLATRVGTITITNEISRQTTKQGPDYFQARADSWLAIFNGIVPTVVPVSQKPKSTTVTARFSA